MRTDDLANSCLNLGRLKYSGLIMLTIGSLFPGRNRTLNLNFDKIL